MTAQEFIGRSTAPPPDWLPDLLAVAPEIALRRGLRELDLAGLPDWLRRAVNERLILKGVI